MNSGGHYAGFRWFPPYCVTLEHFRVKFHRIARVFSYSFQSNKSLWFRVPFKMCTCQLIEDVGNDMRWSLPSKT